MQVIVKHWRTETGRTVELSTALTPEGDRLDDGRLEQLACDQRATAEAVGRLLAWHVENGQMSLATAEEISGCSATLSAVPDVAT